MAGRLLETKTITPMILHGEVIVLDLLKLQYYQSTSVRSNIASMMCSLHLHVVWLDAIY